MTSESNGSVESDTANSSPVVEPPTPELLPDLSLIGVALIWGINIPIMKNGLDKVDSYVFNAVRLAVSVTVLLFFAVLERRAGKKVSSDLPRHKIIVFAVIIAALYQILFLMGIARTTSANTALIISTIPMWTALLAHFFLNERLAALSWYGLVLALVGTTIVAVQKGDVSVAAAHLRGNLFMLGAAVAWSVGTVYSRPMLGKISPMQLSAYAAAMALPMHLMIASGRDPASWSALNSVPIWLAIIYSGSLSTGLALPMWNYGVRHAGAAHAAIIQNLVPVVAIVAAWLSRGEQATPAQIAGGALIITGLVVMRKGRR